MAIEDLLKVSPGGALGVGAAVIAVPILFPSLRPQWAAAVKAGSRLFAEAEGGAEGDIIERLADTAVDQLAGNVAAGTDDARANSAEVVTAYKKRARARANRLGHDPADREARYRRHMAALKRALSGRRDASPDAHGDEWNRLIQSVDAG